MRRASHEPTDTLRRISLSAPGMVAALNMAWFRPDLYRRVLTTSGTSVPVEDAWDADFDYQSDGVNTYSIESFGRDGVPGANITPAQAKKAIRGGNSCVFQ